MALAILATYTPGLPMFPPIGDGEFTTWTPTSFLAAQSDDSGSKLHNWLAEFALAQESGSQLAYSKTGSCLQRPELPLD